MARSQGPDKLKNCYGCFAHHDGERSFSHYNDEIFGSGQKTMIMDYDCCCHPCMYIKPNFAKGGDWSASDDDPVKEHCCNCNPRVILVKWVPEEGDLCDIYPQIEPMFFEAYSISGNPQTVKYEGTIVNHPVVVTLSNYYVGPTGDYSFVTPSSSCGEVTYRWNDPPGSWSLYSNDCETGCTAPGAPGPVGLEDGQLVSLDCTGTPPEPVDGCRWTMYLATGVSFADGYLTATAAIDHNDVTCLGVPTFSFSGISGFGGAGGTVTLSNFDSVKVAFSRRDIFDDDDLTVQSNQYYTLESSNIGIPDYSGIIGTKTFDPPISGQLVPLPSSIIGPPVIDAGFSGPYSAGQSPTGLLPLVTRCGEVPRYLCVEMSRSYDATPQDNYERYREYVYDTGFYPIQRMDFHPSYTGVDYFTTGNVLAKWIYTPLNHGNSGQLPADENKKYLFLYETLVDEVLRFSGDMGLVTASGIPKYVFIPIETDDANSHTDHVWKGGAYYSHPGINYDDYDPGDLNLFDAPVFVDADEEYYWKNGTSSTRTLWMGGNKTHNQFTAGDGSGCPCSLRATAYYDNVSPVYTDNRFIRAGRCTCWKYFCSDECRCLPKELCMLTLETHRSPFTTSTDKNILTWDGSSCWTNGIEGSGGISLCLSSRTDKGFAGKETYNGVCGVSLEGQYFETGYAYSFASQHPITCDYMNIGYTFSDTIIESGSMVANQINYIYPTFEDCSFRTRCDLASPCYLDCGSHPENINLSIRAYSVAPDDEISGPFLPTGVFEFSLPLKYREDFIFTETDPPFYSLCYYEGYYPCGTGIAKVIVHMNAEGSYPLIRFGDMTSSNSDLNPPETKSGFESYTESCDPYYFSGIMNPGGGGYCPFWLDGCGLFSSCGDGAGRMEIIITEE
jgi:hypothetical protein